MIAALFLVVGAIATVLCFAREHRATGYLGALSGGAVLVFYFVAGGDMVEATAPVGLAAITYALVMSVVALSRRAPRGTPEAPHVGAHERLARVLTGALIGALPGVLIMVVPLLLSEMGLITSDQSQIGFIGFPLAPLGLVVGLAIGASTTGRHSSGVTPTDPSVPSGSTPAGWYPDPSGTEGTERYWDGTRWTDQIRATAQASPGG
jgi:hypothetical protein